MAVKRDPGDRVVRVLRGHDVIVWDPTSGGWVPGLSKPFSKIAHLPKEKRGVS